MRLLLQQLRKRGVGIAHFYGPKYGPTNRRQFPYAFSWKEELSTSSKASMYKGSAPTKNSPGSAPSSPGSAPPTKTPGSGNQRVKLVLGSAAVVALITTAFYAEWPGKLPIGENKKEQTPPLPGSEQTDVKGSQVIDDGHLKNESSTHNEQDQVSLNLYKEKEQDTVEGMKQSNGTQEAQSIQEEVEDMQKENTTEEPKDRVEHEANKPGEYMLNASNEEENLKDSELSNDIKGDAVSSDMDGISSKETLSEDHGMKMSVSADVKEVDKSTDSKQEVAAGGTIINGKDSEIRAAHYHDLIASKALQHDDESQHPKPRNILSDTYFLWKGHENNSQRFPNQEDGSDSKSTTKQKEDGKPDFEKQDVLGDGGLILSLIEAIHAAEQKQAESDARIYAEYRQKLKDKFEKELKDARARELMYVEEADSLEKELNKEKAKAAAALKSHQDKAEERLKMELRRKEEEADTKLKKAQLLAKAETAAAIANEKASHLNQMADANLQINALSLAFYTRSEEARQSHSLHKLALGTFALEDAIMKGAPLHKEITVLRASMEGNDKDALLDVALSSVPPETLSHGTKTQAQLHQKFESLKGTLRELALIPAGGGGLFTHALAHFASAVKVREDGLYSEGIESIIAHVEHCLAEGKLIEAANALEKGTQGSKAENLAAEWARQTRNRAVTEQALSLLQAYATAIASSLI